MTSDCKPTMAPIRMCLHFVEMLMCCVFLIICQCFYDKLLNIQAFTKLAWKVAVWRAINELQSPEKFTISFILILKFNLQETFETKEVLAFSILNFLPSYFLKIS